MSPLAKFNQIDARLAAIEAAVRALQTMAAQPAPPPQPRRGRPPKQPNGN